MRKNRNRDGDAVEPEELAKKRGTVGRDFLLKESI
jgi:hypothetical protein